MSSQDFQSLDQNLKMTIIALYFPIWILFFGGEPPPLFS